ncbi:MAG: DUF1847 domain-containing protein [Defluviitaleaceae bacterium]|nr:DUF1847 domain-containing protein [Defluviitaleaceae bacterium]
MKEKKQFSCSDCETLGCSQQGNRFPTDCLGDGVDSARFLELYKNDRIISKVSIAAAEVNYNHTRVQETIAFAKKIGAKKVGISACIALIKEAKNFAKILDTHGIENFCVNCKVGSIEKSEIGVTEKGCLCNPILQAEILNQQETDLNVIIGLCIGHDSLFTKYSNALVTTLVVKDRVLKHNPVAAL